MHGVYFTKIHMSEKFRPPFGPPEAVPTPEERENKEYERLIGLNSYRPADLNRAKVLLKRAGDRVENNDQNQIFNDRKRFLALEKLIEKIHLFFQFPEVPVKAREEFAKSYDSAHEEQKQQDAEQAKFLQIKTQLEAIGQRPWELEKTKAEEEYERLFSLNRYAPIDLLWARFLLKREDFAADRRGNNPNKPYNDFSDRFHILKKLIRKIEVSLEHPEVPFEDLETFIEEIDRAKEDKRRQDRMRKEEITKELDSLYPLAKNKAKAKLDGVLYELRCFPLEKSRRGAVKTWGHEWRPVPTKSK